MHCWSWTTILESGRFTRATLHNCNRVPAERIDRIVSAATLCSFSSCEAPKVAASTQRAQLWSSETNPEKKDQPNTPHLFGCPSITTGMGARDGRVGGGRHPPYKRAVVGDICLLARDLPLSESDLDNRGGLTFLFHQLTSSSVAFTYLAALVSIAFHFHVFRSHRVLKYR